MVIAGVDEAGRGCWAGPLVAAAVILQKPIPGLKDSKKLSRMQRSALATLIRHQAAGIGIGIVRAHEVDKIGLTQATKQAMKLALRQLKAPYDCIIIDGNQNYLPHLDNVQTLIKADALIAEVSAASIIAKTVRDDHMLEMSDLYPEYQFEKHVGYGTALHSAMLLEYGPCGLHRMSYKPVKQIMSQLYV